MASFISSLFCLRQFNQCLPFPHINVKSPQKSIITVYLSLKPTRNVLYVLCHCWLPFLCVYYVTSGLTFRQWSILIVKWLLFIFGPFSCSPCCIVFHCVCSFVLLHRTNDIFASSRCRDIKWCQISFEFCLPDNCTVMFYHLSFRFCFVGFVINYAKLINV